MRSGSGATARIRNRWRWRRHRGPERNSCGPARDTTATRPDEAGDRAADRTVRRRRHTGRRYRGSGAAHRPGHPPCHRGAVDRAGRRWVAERGHPAVAIGATRRDRCAARGPGTAARQRRQQRRRVELVVSRRIRPIFADCRNVAGRGFSSARRCGHSCTHRCRRVSRVSTGESGPRGPHWRYRAVYQLTSCPPRTGST